MKTISLFCLILLLASCQKEGIQIPAPVPDVKSAYPESLKQLAGPCNSKLECKELINAKLIELQQEADKICSSVTGEVICCSNGNKIGYSLFVSPKSGACFAAAALETDGPKTIDKRLSFNIKIQKFGCFAGGITLVPVVLDEELKGQKSGYVFRWSLDDKPLVDASILECSYSIKYTLYVTRISDLKTLAFQGFVVNPVYK